MAGTTVAFIGTNSKVLRLASAVHQAGFVVQAFVTTQLPSNQCSEFQGSVTSSAAQALKGANVAVIIVANLDEVDEILCGSDAAISGMSKESVIVLCSSVPPSYFSKLEKSLTGEKNILLVDAQIVREVGKAADDKPVIVASGTSQALDKASRVLSSMCEKVFHIPEGAGAASKVKMVNHLLLGIHIASAAEAMVLGAKAGLNTRILYDIISNAAGGSWAFVDRVPQMLSGDYTSHSSLKDIVINLGIVLDEAKALPFPLPLTIMALQQYIHAAGCGYAQGSDAAIVKIWERTIGVNVAAQDDAYFPEAAAKDIVMKSKSVTSVGFIGLGAMGFGMATHLVRSNFHVCGFDVYKPTLTRFAEAGGSAGNSPADIAKGSDVIVIMVTNQSQAESVLFGDNGAVKVLPDGATIIVCSTVTPRFMRELEKRLEGEKRDLQLIDAPVSGGVARAAQGTLTIMASGKAEALIRAGTVLSALSEKLYIIQGAAGAGSSVKMINQLLAGVHIASAAEAMAFGARLGLNSRNLFDIISDSDGNSWMFGNRVPHMLENDLTPYSAIDIFVKDLGIVLQEAKELSVPVYIAASAHQQYLLASAAGWGRYDDSAVVKIFETLTGVKVEASSPVLPRDETLKFLPPEWPVDPSEEIIQLENHAGSKVLVVLDDDPTGTQTVHGITVLTEWTVTSLVEQFIKRPSCFFILTNSRALGTEKAALLTKEICQNIAEAAVVAKDIKYTVVLRGDSTLRGHFPEEADSAASVIGEIDAWIICPFFLQGGRYTIHDIHYVADSDKLVPAGRTEFAKDAAFGYKASNLREWVEEKTKGRVPAANVASVTIQTIRKGGPDAVCQQLCNLPKGSICIVNAASDRDMSVFAAGMIKAELQGKQFLCRTAASFVSARIGIKAKDPVTPKQLGIFGKKTGGLIVVGSYVPKTTKQVEELINKCGHFVKRIEVSVDAVALKSGSEREDEISNAVELANMFLKSKNDTVIMTSRNLVKGKSAAESLEINSRVSSALVEIVRRIQTRPRYFLAKGGITSSDLATKALEARRAEVVGQAFSGVPLWQLGPESRHPGVPYIVFPGNVGGEDALAQVVMNWASPRASTKDLLLDADKGGYAVGAFNVYNLEAVSAVVAAAEEERSPAILQIHPSALKHGGPSLVACCLSSAEHASVPITVHFDHGAEKEDIIEALEMGIDSVMVDGSHLTLDENICFTKYLATLAHSKDKAVEAELGRLSGTEDDLTVEEYEAKLTDVNQAEEFLNQTGVDALAVCIGNVHGKYPAGGPKLKLDILKELHAIASKKGVILVLHGASGLPSDIVKACIELGVRKFNVNTEVRSAYVKSLQNPKNDLIDIMAFAKESMKTVVAEKMRLFGSSGKAC